MLDSVPIAHHNSGYEGVSAHLATLTNNMLEHDMADSIIIPEGAKAILIANSDKLAIVDKDDYDSLIKCKWYIRKDGYLNNARGKLIHRIIMNPPSNMVIDHINRDKLDNRKCNLRICNQSQNLFNQESVRGGTSKYKGVHWHTKRKGWIAKIMVNKKLIHIGQFKSELDAANAYNESAKKYYGEFARLNAILEK